MLWGTATFAAGRNRTDMIVQQYRVDAIAQLTEASAPGSIEEVQWNAIGLGSRTEKKHEKKPGLSQPVADGASAPQQEIQQQYAWSYRIQDR